MRHRPVAGRTRRRGRNGSILLLLLLLRRRPSERTQRRLVSTDLVLQILHGGVKLGPVELAGAEVGVFDAGRFVRSVQDRRGHEGRWGLDGVRLVGLGNGVGG